MSNQQPYIGGFNKDVFTKQGGGTAHAISFRPMGGALTPDHPLRFRLKPKGAATVQFLALHHQKSETAWVPVPMDTTGFISIKVP